MRFSKEEKDFIDGIVSALKNVVQKEKELEKILSGKTSIYDDVIYDLQLVLFKRLNLEFGVDGEDDGNVYDGLFSYVIRENITIWDLLDIKKESNAIYDSYRKKEIDLDTLEEKMRNLYLRYRLN